MCYRFKNVQDEQEFRAQMKRIGKIFKQETTGGKFQFYHTNGFAHEELPVVTMETPNDISYMHWGLIPSGIKNKADKDKYWKMGYTLNARSEEIFTTWSFKNAIRDKRCLIPATGFFEWREYEGVKYPYLIQVKSDDFPDEITPFCFAGVYDHWVDKESGEVIDGFAIITTSANELMKKVHVNPKRPDQGGRMPVIVHTADYDKWLSPTATFEELESVMQPYPDEYMDAYTISKLITSRKVDPNTPETLVHQAYEELGDETRLNTSII